MVTKKTTISSVVSSAFFIAAFVSGCDDPEPAECGGHGHLHDGYCHCDEGYVVDPDDETSCVEDTGESWCTEEHDDWEHCVDGVIQWCHVMEGMEPHPHAGQDCTAAGLECVQVSDSEAACVDTSSSCIDGEHECSADNEARNCVGGNWAIEPCGSLHCHEEDGEAHCEEEGDECGGHGHLHDGHCDCDEGYIQDPDDELNCIEEPAECGGHGHFHDGHCDCDEGFVQDPNDETNCIPEEECGGHGHLHDGHCDCDEGYIQDPDNAVNCIEEPECGGHGHLHGDHCDCDEGYMQDPEDAMNCIEIPFPQVACNTFAAGSPHVAMVTTDFDSVFSEDYHVHPDELMSVELPDNETSYIHFPIEEDGNYVLFLDTADVFVAAWHRDHTPEFNSTGDVPNGMCEEDLVEHWHITATYDGDGSGPVPGVIEFGPVAGGATVQFIVSLHE